jgi:hypothetical protein
MNREQITERLQPLFDDLVERVAALVPELVREHLVETLGKLTGEADEKPKRARKVVHRDPRPAKKSGRKPNSCSKCGATGFTAATCGKTHNIGEDSILDALDRQMDVRVDRKPPPSTAGTIASLRSRRPPKRAAASSAPDDGRELGLHEVVAFTF